MHHHPISEMEPGNHWIDTTPDVKQATSDQACQGCSDDESNQLQKQLQRDRMQRHPLVELPAWNVM